ncbi:MAG: FkbM family methyltransferase [Hyphomicrobiales bacterium]|nr:FkbM family methyltransferase [Hyphomicrobiales bacterium]MDE2115784.1 FkbM family methyltransferase [Hyphomicrobiales bacterium]
MKPLSYAQNMEDMQLAHALGERVGFYLDIGAGHPIADNVSLYFYERGWRGLVVEPQPELARLYAALRPRDGCVQALIGQSSGVADFHVFSTYHGLSTMVEAHAKAAAQLGEAATTQQLPVQTLAQLCADHQVGEIDFLKIDVEGAEADVLMGNDWSRYRPKIIVAEAIAPGTQAPSHQAFEPFLQAQGYQFVLFDTLNRFYVAQECPEIIARFDGTRIDWGIATHMYEIGRAPENARHPDHALANTLAQGLWASLPHMPREWLAQLILRGEGKAPDAPAIAALATALDGEAMRLGLGRIAAGYDGGQIYPSAKGE